MEEIVTYLEMTAPDLLKSSAPVPGLVMESLPGDSPLIPGILARIGAPHGWRSASRTPADWQAWLTERPARQFFLLQFGGEPAGMAVYDSHPGDEVEIKTFGLLPESVGKGLGGFALTLAVQRAWSLHPTVKRVWLHTSSLDHPNALPNYRSRGFRPFKTEKGHRGRS